MLTVPISPKMGIYIISEKNFWTEKKFKDRLKFWYPSHAAAKKLQVILQVIKLRRSSKWSRSDLVSANNWTLNKPVSDCHIWVDAECCCDAAEAVWLPGLKLHEDGMDDVITAQQQQHCC